MVSVAIWLVSRARNFTHALLFADLGAENGFSPDECEAMQCALGSLAPPLKTSGKTYRGRSRCRKKIRCREVIAFRICKTVRKDGGGKKVGVLE
jgi:hypothetical protein